MSVKIIVDSACDLTPEEGKDLNIQIIPLRYMLGDKEYLDGITISNTEFYKIITTQDVFPKTSQITPFQYEQAFEEGLKECDEVLCMTMSSGVSGCYQSACLAQSEFDEKVMVFNSQHFCFSYTVLVKYAVMLRDQGLNVKEIYDKLTEALQKVRIIAVFDTLEYLKKGGRLSAGASIIGNVLGIKPIITISEGKVKVIKTVRGIKKGMISMDEYLDEEGEIDFDMPIVSGYTGVAPDQLNEFMEKYGSRHFEGRELPVEVVGTTVGSYAGPDAFAIGYFVK